MTIMTYFKISAFCIFYTVLIFKMNYISYYNVYKILEKEKKFREFALSLKKMIFLLIFISFHVLFFNVNNIIIIQ